MLLVDVLSKMFMGRATYIQVLEAVGDEGRVTGITTTAALILVAAEGFVLLAFRAGPAELRRTIVSESTYFDVRRTHTASSRFFLSMFLEKYVMGQVIAQWKHSCSTAGPPRHRLQQMNRSVFGSKAFLFFLDMMIHFCKSTRRLAEY